MDAPAPEQEIDDTLFPIIFVPFFGKMIPIRVRELTGTQVYFIDENLSLIETFQDKLAQQGIPTFEEMAAYAERQHRLCKLSLVSPTYQQIMDICEARLDLKSIDKQLDELRAKFMQIEIQKGDDRIKKQLQAEFNLLEFQYKFLLPADFLAAVMNYALKISDTDIKKVTAEILLNAAIMANKGHDSPADHCPGNFTDFNREDINRRSWLEYQRFQEENAR